MLAAGTFHRSWTDATYQFLLLLPGLGMFLTEVTSIANQNDGCKEGTSPPSCLGMSLTEVTSIANQNDGCKEGTKRHSSLPFFVALNNAVISLKTS
jgi:hypothetical protein